MFDKNKFANILKKINETYENQTYFASASGVNRTYLSQYMNLKLDNPPSPKVLLGIAQSSKGLTTYDELMQVCGYIDLAGLSDIDLNDDEKKILRTILLDYKNYLQALHTPFDMFDEQKYLVNCSKEAKDKLTIAFRRNSIDLILNAPKVEDDDYFEFTSEDDAMFPLLDVGDIALVYKQNNIEDGATLLINIDNHKTIRKFKLSEDKTYYTLSAMNVYYKNIDLKVSDIDKIKVLGKVIKSENKSAFK